MIYLWLFSISAIIFHPHLGSCEAHRPRHGPKPPTDVTDVTVHGAPAVPSTATMGWKKNQAATPSKKNVTEMLS